jgi:hypothetical protein
VYWHQKKQSKTKKKKRQHEHERRGMSPLAIQLTAANRGELIHFSLLDWLARCGEIDIAWLNQFRRLRVRYEKRADIHEAFLSLGCALICWRFLRVD